MSFEVNLDVFKYRLSKNMCRTHIFEHYTSIIVYGIYACICIRLCRINVVPNVALIMNVYIYIYMYCTVIIHIYMPVMCTRPM